MNEKNVRDLKVAVVGVGGVGGYLAGMLANALPHVSVTARGARGEAIREHGIVLHSDYNGEIRAVPEHVYGSTAELPPQDVIFLCVKNYSLAAACEELKGAVTAGTVVVPVMNGVDPAERAAALLGTGTVVSALIYIVAFANPDYSITQQGKFASLRIGIKDADQAQQEKTALAGDVLAAAGIDVKISSDIEADVWRKYILNCAYNVATARYACPIGGLRADPVKSKEYEELLRECAAVAVKKGVRVGDEDVERNIFSFYHKLADTDTSSLQRDVEAGRPSEIETFSGYIVREGKRLGVPVPVSEAMYEALLAVTKG